MEERESHTKISLQGYKQKRQGKALSIPQAHSMALQNTILPSLLTGAVVRNNVLFYFFKECMNFNFNS
jgi:hypothetical protein